MATVNLKALRETLTPEDIKSILATYDVEFTYENDLYIQFPTCCHNLHGGSPKLYYYKNTHLFRCYTECGDIFDIVELIIKMNKLRGKEISINEAIQSIGYESNEAPSYSNEEKHFIDTINQIHSKMWNDDITAVKKEIPHSVLNKYIYNENYLMPWIEEGISRDVLRQFEIKYDPLETAIVIPHKNIDGKLIGVRGRFMAQDAVAKYMPLKFNDEYMNHQLGLNLYGIYENKDAIRKNKMVIIFEAEKSVLKFGSCFGVDNNFSVATCGNKISNEQIQLLVELGVKQVVLAFDKDYSNDIEMRKVKQNYEKIGKRLSNYFTTSIILDYGILLGLKDSPIDRGKTVFEELYKYRYFM